MVVGLAAVAGVIAMVALVHTVAPAVGVRDTVFLGTAGAIAVAGLLSARIAVVAVVLGVLFTAWLRRVFPAADVQRDYAAVVPFVLMLPLVVLGVRRRAVPAWVFLGLVLFAVTGIRDVVTGAPAYLALVATTVGGLAVRSDPRLTRLLVLSWLTLSPVSWAYGLVQKFHTPSYDSQWLIDSEFGSAGIPGDPGFRQFATFQSPAPGAFLAVVTLLIAVSAFASLRIPLTLRVVNAMLTLTYLALCGVRSAWIFGAVAVLMALAANARRAVTFALVPFMITVVVVMSQVPALSAIFATRADTLGDLSSDRSYQARSTLLSNIGNFVSLGGGGLGTGSNADQTASAFDNGYLIVLAEGGLIGVVALVAVIWGVVRQVARERLPFVVLWLLAAVSGDYFSNTFTFLVIAMMATTAVAVEQPSARAHGDGAGTPGGGSAMAPEPVPLRWRTRLSHV